MKKTIFRIIIIYLACHWNQMKKIKRSASFRLFLKIFKKTDDSNKPSDSAAKTMKWVYFMLIVLL
jgi:hypothetical protein